MQAYTRRFWIVLAVSAIAIRPCCAAEVKVLCSVALKSVLTDLVPAFEGSSGNHITISYATAGALKARIQSGEAFDVAILPRPFIDPLIQAGVVAPASVRELARSAVAVAVKAGGPVPDIGTADTLRAALLSARSVSYADPAKGGGSGIQAARAMELLGIAEAMKPKTKLVDSDGSVDLVARGEAEIAIVNTPVIVAQPGVRLVGPLPAGLWDPKDFVFLAGASAKAVDPGGAAALIAWLRGADAIRAFQAKGLDAPERP